MAIKSTNFTLETRRWLNFVSQRICLSMNLMDVTYHRVIFFPFLITEICQRVGVLAEVEDSWIVCDRPLDPLKVKDSRGRSKKKRNMGAKGENNRCLRGEESRTVPSWQTGPFRLMESDLAMVKNILLQMDVSPQKSSPSISTGPSDLQSVYTSFTRAYVELQKNYKEEKKKRCTWERFLIGMWKAMKSTLGCIILEEKMPKVRICNAQEFFYMSGLDENGFYVSRSVVERTIRPHHGPPYLPAPHDF